MITSTLGRPGGLDEGVTYPSRVERALASSGRPCQTAFGPARYVSDLVSTLRVGRAG